MGDPRDDLARAYATLGLTPGTSLKDATRTYKGLVKRWHPDRHATDPQGQSEAALRLREINRAFALVRQSLAPTPSRAPQRGTPSAAAPDAAPRATPPGARLTEAELQEIADAIGREDLGATLGRYLFRGLALGCGYLLIAQPRFRPKNTVNTIAGIVVLCTVAAHWAYTIWRNRGSDPTGD